MRNIKLFEEFTSPEDIYTITYENPVFVRLQNDDEEYDLLDYANSADIIMDDLLDDFNEHGKLEKYTHDKLSDNVITIRGVDFDINKSTFTIEVRFKGEPTKKDIEDIKKYISGQCSDGWGEGYEQSPREDRFFISTWSRDGKKIEHIKTEKED